MYYMVGAATQQARGKQAQAARTKRRQESEDKAKKGERGPEEDQRVRDETTKAPGEPSNQDGGKLSDRKPSKQASSQT
jgi:hypothetical protein